MPVAKSVVGKSVLAVVRAALSCAIEEVCGVRDEAPPLIPFAKSDEFDYQSAFAQKIYDGQARKVSGWKERFPSQAALAESVGKKLCECNSEIVSRFHISENGFLLLLLADSLLAEQMNTWLAQGVHLSQALQPQTIVVDFSSPNIAKEMHVGHLRSTIIGESMSRVLEACGHKVLRVNHVGDWGTQFGMLIAHLFEVFPDFVEKKPKLSDLEQFYKESKRKFDQDEIFKQKAHQCVVRLQAGDVECVGGWKALCDISREFFTEIYTRLDITNQEVGESFYNSMIPSVIDELKEKQLVRIDEGALCLYLPGHPKPLMVVKSDGGFNYDTTDLAAARYRLQTLKADRVIYITDVGQYTHFAAIFDAAKLAGWAGSARMDHMGFGIVLGEDGKRMKTRAGKSVKLMALLDEAKERAKTELKARLEAPEEEEGKRRTQLSPEEFDAAAETLGIAAVKYFDLRQNRLQNYPFNLDAMLNQKGDTAVYLMYSYIRVCSILRRAEVDIEALRTEPFVFTHEQERVLARHLVTLTENVEAAVDQLHLNKLCVFLYSLAAKVAESYAVYKILGSRDTPNRLRLMLIIHDMMLSCFTLLGIKTIERI